MKRTAAYETANTVSSLPNACGTASPVMKMEIIEISRAARSASPSGSAALAAHTNADHAHQISASTSSPRPAPRQLSSCVISAVTWVTANTKTRSRGARPGLSGARRSLAGRAVPSKPLGQERVDDLPAPVHLLDQAATRQARKGARRRRSRAQAVAVGQLRARQSVAGVVGQQVEGLALGRLRLLAVRQRLLGHGEVGGLVVHEQLECVLDQLEIDRPAGALRPCRPRELLRALRVGAGQLEQVFEGALRDRAVRRLELKRQELAEVRPADRRQPHLDRLVEDRLVAVVEQHLQVFAD